MSETTTRDAAVEQLENLSEGDDVRWISHDEIFTVVEVWGEGEGLNAVVQSDDDEHNVRVPDLVSNDWGDALYEVLD